MYGLISNFQQRTPRPHAPVSFFFGISEDEALRAARGREYAVMRLKDKRALAARRVGTTQEEREAAKEAAKRRRAAETPQEAEARRERERDRDRRRAAKRKAARCAAAATAKVPRRPQPEPPPEVGTDGDDGSVAGRMTRHRSRWSAEGDKDFGDADAKVYSGIEVPPEWVTAADFAVTKMVSKEERDAAVEAEKTLYHYACMHGVWRSYGKQKARKELLERLKDMERMMQHRVRTHAAVPPRTPVELRTFVARVYSGGPNADEVVKTHTDTVVNPDGKQDERPVVSAVFVLQGGFSESGYDVRIHGERGKYYFPHLETGDLLALAGGDEGVVHDVAFYGNPERTRWRRRLTAVAFYVVGSQKGADARASVVA